MEILKYKYPKTALGKKSAWINVDIEFHQC